MKQHLLSQSPTQWADWFTEHGQRSFRAAQVTQWIYHRRAFDFEGMTNIPQPLRQQLAASFEIVTTQIARHHKAEDGTEKLVLRLADGKHVECVLLRDGGRRTICVSSQVGCAMGCVFCASGLDGVDRNLTSGEIIEQALRLQALLPADERLSHVVMMGMGEPLANLEAVLEALDRIHAEDGLGIGARRITISTVGLPAAMDRLTEKNPGYHLAVSLHAATDVMRDELVPVNNKIGVQKILEAADRYFETSGRRLTYEYVLLAGVNDSVQDANALARLLKGRPALLNVIPYNPVEGLPYRTPTAAAIERFRNVLERAGLTIQFRQRKGDKINAACGQLRRQVATPQVETVTIAPPAGHADHATE